MSVRLNYKIYGNGKHVYILHGLFGSHRNWTSVARELSKRYQLITVDLRNHGDSGHTDVMNYIEMAEDIRDLSADLGHKKISIIGHSMGGKTAMTLALLLPSLIEHLIIVDIAPAQYPSNHEDLITAMQTLPLETLNSRDDADTMLSEYVSEPLLRAFLLQNLVRAETGFKWRINLDAIWNNQAVLRGFPEELSNDVFKGPTLFLSGELSDYIRPEHHDVMAGYFPESKHNIVKDARHWVHADQPAAVISEIQNFLS